MPRAHYDVAVIGLGAMGSAAAWHCAARGLRTIGFDRHTPPHSWGSSHGRSRIIRQAYFEGPAYVPLVQRAYQLWQELERATGRRLLRLTGGLMIGPPTGVLVAGARTSAEQHGLPYELLDGRELRARYPMLRAPEGTAAILEPNAGMLDPEACITAMLAAAAEAGGELNPGTPIQSVAPSREGFALTGSMGSVTASAVVVATGAWLGSGLGGLSIPLAIERQTMFWFAPTRHAEAFGPDRFPVFIWEWEPDRLFYGMPDTGAGVKLARHHEGTIVTPESVDRTIGVDDERRVRDLAQRFIPAAAGERRDAAVCLYANTPDQHFVVGEHPERPGLVLLSPCSGHGFKFASAIGEAAADLVQRRSPRCDLRPFSPARFAPGA